jgi:hypothetical protein
MGVVERCVKLRHPLPNIEEDGNGKNEGLKNSYGIVVGRSY